MEAEFSTPMMVQYRRLKREYHDCILLFRLGDFYEMFDRDAQKASEVLGIALTSREAGKGKRIPMCGVPFHSASRYIQKLLDAGHKVAICEQVEDPKKAKGLVRREVVEVLTPGVLTREEFLDESKKNYLASVFFGKKKVGFSIAEVSTGDFLATEWTLPEGSQSDSAVELLKDELRLRNPKELLCAGDGISPDSLNVSAFGMPVEWVGFLSPESAREVLSEILRRPMDTDPQWQNSETAIQSAGLIARYLKEHKLDRVAHLNFLRPFRPSGKMFLDFATVRNLELFSTPRGEEGSLFALLNHTKTPMGKRLLREEILAPSTDVEQIQKRLNAVEELVEKGYFRDELREILSGIGDIERMSTRIVGKKGRPYDLFRLRSSLQKISALVSLQSSCSSWVLQEIFQQLQLDERLQRLLETLKKALAEEFSADQIFREGYDAQLDEWQKWLKEGKEWLKKFEERERLRTGLKTLKVRYNEVFGYFIEITKAQIAQIPRLPEGYERKQTLVSVERFTTPELKEAEQKIFSASESMEERKNFLIEQLLNGAQQCIAQVLQIAKNVALLDVLQSFAEAAEQYGYTRPEVNSSDRIEVNRGRHPMVEHLLPPGEFVPNDVVMEGQAQRLIILTGPNMAGKSTYIRQVGLIVLLAQMGCFVPADSARIGVVDALFTRAGASDDISRGVSTFFMEMSETARILQFATPKSLVILDEVGRGTSTYDGMCIAWAIAEYLASRLKCRTIFATHFHELTVLEQLVSGVQNFQMLAKEERGKAIFLHKVVKGGAEKSYGIYVAGLAGLPPLVVRRASELLSLLEQKSAIFPLLSSASFTAQLSLFGDFSSDGGVDSQL